MWRNWQTRRSQKPVMVTSWRFKSSHPHHEIEKASPENSGLAFSHNSVWCQERFFNLPPINTPIAAINGNVNGAQVGQYAFPAASICGTSPTLTKFAFVLAFITEGTANNSPTTNTTIANANGALPPLAIALHIRPPMTAVMKLITNDIAIHRLDARYERGRKA